MWRLIYPDVPVLPVPPVTGWTDGYTFILSFLSPLWTIAGFDSSVHISEEASNAAIAVPWAIVSAIGIAGILGWGTSAVCAQSSKHNLLTKDPRSAVNMSLAFCMGSDIESLLNSPIGQPMAQIFFNSFGQNGTLALWAFVVIVQYMMGSSMVRQAFFSLKYS